MESQEIAQLKEEMLSLRMLLNKVSNNVNVLLKNTARNNLTLSEGINELIILMRKRASNDA